MILTTQDMARRSLWTVCQGMQRAKSDLSSAEHHKYPKFRGQLLELKTAEVATSFYHILR